MYGLPDSEFSFMSKSLFEEVTKLWVDLYDLRRDLTYTINRPNEGVRASAGVDSSMKLHELRERS
jgi:hypothetical protein